MAQTVFKSTNGLIPMDYAPIYREKHIKGFLDRRIMGDSSMEKGIEATDSENHDTPKVVVIAEEPTEVEVVEVPKQKYNRVR